MLNNYDSEYLASLPLPKNITSYLQMEDETGQRRLSYFNRQQESQSEYDEDISQQDDCENGQDCHARNHHSSQYQSTNKAMPMPDV